MRKAVVWKDRDTGEVRKRCAKCLQVKNSNEFYQDQTKLFGLSSYCLECRKKHAKNYHKKNLACIKVQRKAYREQNREKLVKKNRAYYSEERVRILAQKRQKHLEDPRVSMLTDAKKRAKSKGLEFSLELADISIPSVCPVLGIPIIVYGERHTWHSPSLDRIDNSLGYVKSNVIVVSRRANSLKSDATVEELEAIVKFYKRLQCKKVIKTS